MPGQSDVEIGVDLRNNVIVGQIMKKIRREECYAKFLLEIIFPQEFSMLRIADKPDLQSLDAKKGIEVVSAIDQNDMEAQHLFKKINEMTLDEKKEKSDIEKIRKLGGQLFGTDGKGMMITTGDDSFTLIISQFKKKLERLNNAGYQEFPEYCLYVKSEIFADEKMKKDALSEMIEITKNVSRTYERVFSKVFVDLYSEVIVFDLLHDSYIVKEVDIGTRDDICSQTNEYIENCERLQ